MGRAEDLFRRLSEEREAAIDALIQERQSEELFLDFKRSADNGAGPRLHENDRKNLARAISGFGNSAGGVLLWGVEGETATTKAPITEPKRFANWLEGKISGCTLPPHIGVGQAVIERPGTSTGFVATLIPQSPRAPHQCLVGTQYYYIRAGSDFIPAPHGVLARLFGQSPQPFVFHTWQFRPAKAENMAAPGQPPVFSARVEVGFGLASHGPGIARDLYVTAQIIAPSGHADTRAWCHVPDERSWHRSSAFGRIFGVVSVDGYKLAPDIIVEPMVLGVRLVPPFSSGLSYSITFGHGTSPVRNVSGSVGAEVIAESYRVLVEAGEEAGENVGRCARAIFDVREPRARGSDYYDLG